jgi:hypothetical protein
MHVWHLSYFLLAPPLHAWSVGPSAPCINIEYRTYMEMNVANGTRWPNLCSYTWENSKSLCSFFLTGAYLFYTGEVDRFGDTASVSDD